MAAGVDLEKLRSILECSICLEQYEEPKMLACTHEFCKRCIEDIAVFNTDGSVCITCPLRCEAQTRIPVDQTAAFLGSSYTTKSILDSLHEDNSQENTPPLMCDTCCAKPVSRFCCDKAKCKVCFTTHLSQQTDQFGHTHFHLSYSRKEDKLVAMCEEHESAFTKVCIGHFKLLCMYCVERDPEHKSHPMNIIEDDVALLREALGNEIKRLKESGDDPALNNEIMSMENLLQKKDIELMLMKEEILLGLIKHRQEFLVEGNESSCKPSAEYLPIETSVCVQTREEVTTFSEQPVDECCNLRNDDGQQVAAENVYCVYTPLGCPWFGSLSAKPSHENACSFVNSICKNVAHGCTWNGPLNQKNFHEQNCQSCGPPMSICVNVGNGCSWSGPLSQKFMHELGCLFTRTGCTNVSLGCAWTGPVNFKPTHEQICGFKNMFQHNTICGNVANGCAWNGPVNYKQPHEQSCGFKNSFRHTTICINVSKGCTWNGPISHQHMHEQSCGFKNSFQHNTICRNVANGCTWNGPISHKYMHEHSCQYFGFSY